MNDLLDKCVSFRYSKVRYKNLLRCLYNLSGLVKVSTGVLKLWQPSEGTAQGANLNINAEDNLALAA